MTYKPKATGWPQLIDANGLFSNSATPLYELGIAYVDKFGNAYRYVKANEALAVGHVVTAVALAAWDTTTVVDGAVSSGASLIHVDTTTSAWTAGQYTGYYVSQAAASGKGMSYRIASHDAVGAAGEVDVYLEDTVNEAFADGAVLYIFNPFLVEKVDATTEIPRGVAIGTITSGYYGFVQVGGFVQSVLVGHSTSNATVVNAPVVPVGAGVEGAMQGLGTGTASAQILQAGVNRICALEVVGANTVGYIRGIITGML